MNIFNWFSKSKTYFTSDLHFGHLRVIEYCNRPFKSIDEMTDAIVKEWNKTVRPKDTIFVLGDFSLNKKWSKNLLPKLNGHKILIAGNHDECHISHRNHKNRVQTYLEHGWEAVYPHNVFITLKNAMKVQLCHLPYAPENDAFLDTRYMNLRPQKETEILLHGHLHGNYIKYKNQIDVSWDAHNGKIISEDQLIKIIEDKRDFIPSHLTEWFKTRNRRIKE